MAEIRAGHSGEEQKVKPTLAVWKFASCDGCQLTLLDCEDELLTIAEQIEIAMFAEASSAMVAGPYDVSLVEGSVTTAHDERRIRDIREQSKVLVTIGACATAGGVQALRNFADVDEFAIGGVRQVRNTSTRWPRRHRRRRTSPSTTNCAGAPSTAGSSSTHWPRC